MWKNGFIMAAVIVMFMARGGTSVLAQEESNSPPLKVRSKCANGVQSGARIMLQIDPDSDSAVSGSRGQKDGYLRGKLVSCSEGTLVLRPQSSNENDIRIPIKDVRSLYVSESGSSHALGGASIGLAIGLVVALVTQGGPVECEGMLCGLDEGINKMVNGIAITLGGTIFGFAIGRNIKGSDDWTRVYGEKWESSFERSSREEYQVAAGFSF